MSYFRIVAVNPPGKTVEVLDGEQTFKIAEELDALVMDILRDDEYAFSLCRLAGKHGFWAIFQRNAQASQRIGDPSRWRHL